MGLFFESTISFIWEKLKGKACAKTIECLKNKELEDQISKYTEQFYEEKIENSCREQEIDFEGLNKYLSDAWDEHIMPLFYKGNTSDTEFLLFLKNRKETIYAEACEGAKANNQCNKRLVRYYIDNIFQIVDNFLLNQINKENNYLAQNMETELLNQIDSWKEETVKRINSHVDYRGSFAEYLDNVKEPRNTKRQYHYLNKDIGFFGRTEDIQYLDGFLDNEEDFLFTVITGPGGVGKSKLLYHYMKINRENPEWKIVFADHVQIEEISEKYSEFAYYKNVMIIVDYAGQIAETVKKLCYKFKDTLKRPTKVRIVLLERGSNEKDVKPYWYKNFDPREALSDYLYMDKFYELKYMDKNALFHLIDNIAGSKNKIDTRTKNEIYNTVLKIVQEGSPLYTILVTDAYLSDKPLRTMDSKKLLKYVIEKDEDYWENTICKKDDKMYYSLREMIVYSTACGGWDFKELPEPLDQSSKYLADKCFGSTQVKRELLDDFLDERDDNLILKPLEPDVIGEFYVLRWLLDRTTKEDYKKIICLFWEAGIEFLYFLYRCTSDYLNKTEYKNLIVGSYTILDAEHSLPNAIILYNLTVYQQDAEYMKEMIAQLRQLTEENPGNVEIEVLYAEGLVNLSADQDVEGVKETIETLRKLTEENPGNVEIAVEYAKGLFNLSNSQDVEEAKGTIETLRQLTEENPGNVEIEVLYAKGLVNLSVDQDVEEGKETIETLRKLTEENPGIEEIAVEYAQGLVNLSVDQDVEEGKETIETLRKLTEENPGTEEIAVEYAKGLWNLCLRCILEKNINEAKIVFKEMNIKKVLYMSDKQLREAYLQIEDIMNTLE